MNRLLFIVVFGLLAGFSAADARPWPHAVVRYRLDASAVPYRAAVSQALGLWLTGQPALVFQEVPDSWVAGWTWFWDLDRTVVIRADKTLTVFGATTLGCGPRSELVFNPDLSTPPWLAVDLAHEWGHVLGLTHEHQRRDRDLYIAFPPGFLGSLPADRRPDYAKLADDPGAPRPYDYDSLMHYSSNIDGSRLVRRDTLAFVPAATRPSPGDRARLAALYFFCSGDPMMTARDWIETLGLEPHPEGGYYRETYRSPRLLGGRAPVSTAIYFLLTAKDISAFHRISSDEMWHLYAVTPLTRLRIWRITPQGKLGTFLLGNEPVRNEVFQDVVPGGDWFAGEVEVLGGGDPAGAFVLAGCTVSPGFQFADFELAEPGALARQWPEHEGLIRRLSVQSS